MPRFNPYTLQMQITRMFEQGQSVFATTKVQDWLRQHNEDPADYEIIFHERPAPPGSKETKAIEIELRRRDGQAVDAWLQQELSQST
jgi:hypothetical protein